MIACRYKNFKCTSHNKFFELNLYQKDPVHRHHWRANIARPAADIDLDASSGGQVSAQDDTKIEGRQSITIQKNTGDESKVDSAKPASDFDDSIARVLAGIPKLRLEEVPEGVSSNSLDERAGRMPVTISGDLLKKEEEEEEEEEEEKDGDDEYDEGNDYGRGGYGLYDDERED